MFNSKLILFIVSILILCLVIVGCYQTFFDTTDLNTHENSNDTAVIRMLDDNGNVELVQVSDAYDEFEATS